jgi:hypothetical protein
MTEHTWADMADDELDAALRGEMAVLQASAPVPAVDAGAIQRRARPRFLLRDPAVPRRLAPAALAVGLAALVALGSGTWLTVQRLHGRTTTPATTPSPMPRVTPAPSPGQLPAAFTSTVPAGVPVFWYALQVQPSSGAVRLEAVDWSGARRGHLDLTGIGAMPAQAGGNLGVVQSPDGERLLVLNQVYSSDGRFLYDLPQNPAGAPTWGDDSRTICLVTRPTAAGVNATDLVVLDGSGARRPVESVLGTGSDESHIVKACAVSTDRVVDYVQIGLDVTKVQVRKLSSNQVLLDQTLPPCASPSTGCGPTPDNLSVSANGRVAAESDRGGLVRVRDLTTGAVRTLSRRGGVLQISADGTRLLLGRPNFVYGGPVYPLTLIDVSTGRVLWTHAESGVLSSDAGAQPGGSTIAVAYSAYDHNAAPPPGAQNDYIPSPPSTLVLLTGGTARTIATGVHSLFFTS